MNMTIGTIAKLAGVGVETVRFYERQGLVPRPRRQVVGYRQYPLETVDRLRFIRRAKGLGFTLREIRELLDLRFDGTTKCSDMKHRAETKVKDIDDRIKALKQMRKTLNSLAKACSGRAGSRECPILDALTGKEPGDES